MLRVGALTGTAAAALALVVWTTTGVFGPGMALAAVLDPVATATNKVNAIHLVMTLLTREGEDFEYVNTGGSPERVEAWVEWPRNPGERGRMRIDKRDRIYSFDGTESIYFHPLRGEAYRGRGPGLSIDLFWPGAWLRRIRSLPTEGVEVLVHRETDGHGYLLLREQGVETAPRGPVFLGEFDRETEVEWDLDTHLLTGLRRWVYDGDERRLFLEVAAIDYLPAIDDERFVVDMPRDVRWGGVKEASALLASLGPREAAERLFEAAMSGDRDTLEILVPSPHMVEWLLDEAHRPSEIAFVGEPFRTGSYPGVYVPYRVRLGSDMRSHRLALRNDNQQRRWVFDGGI